MLPLTRRMILVIVQVRHGSSSKISSYPLALQIVTNNVLKHTVTRSFNLCTFMRLPTAIY